MTEEKKDEQVKNQEAPKPAEAAPAVQADIKKEEKAAPAKVDRPMNCVGCKKSIKKRWYYRDNNYYCTKRCWSVTTKKPVQAEEKPAAS